MIGIYGGTFDPVHFGHLRSAWEVRERLRIRDFRILPAGHPAHRGPPVAAARHRLEMLRLATHGLPGIRLDEREIDREGPSYMVDTLAEIRTEAPGQPLLLILGQDSAATLDTWHRWQELTELAHLVIMQRPGTPPSLPAPVADHLEGRAVERADELASTRSGKVHAVAVTQLDISASAIRALVGAGRSPRFLLPDAVLQYIGSEGLYR